MENLLKSGERLFTCGCFIVPRKLEDGRWAWVVDAFEDVTFLNGDYVDVSSVWCNDVNDLIRKEEDVD